MDRITELVKLSIMMAFGSVALWGNVYASEVHSQSGGFTGNATPTQYIITISAIEFHKVGDDAATYHPFVTTSANWDIASANPGSSLGAMKSTSTLPAGTYDKIRFTVSKTMTIKASIAALSDGSPCRSEGDAQTVSNPFGAGVINTAYLGARDGSTAEPETVTVPSGSNVEPSPDFTDLGSSFRGSMTLGQTFTVVNGSIPAIKLKFDVTNAAQFTILPDGSARCVVFPGPPSLSVDVA